MSEKTVQLQCVTALQIVLHLLPLVSGGAKSAKSWEWPDFGGLTQQTDLTLGMEKQQEQLCTPS